MSRPRNGVGQIDVPRGAFQALLDRRKADTANDQEERGGLVKMADDLVDKVKEIKHEVGGAAH